MELKRNILIVLIITTSVIVVSLGVLYYFNIHVSNVHVSPSTGGKMIEEGDCIDVDYIGKFASNGTIFDTSYESIAKENGLYTQNRSYEPLKIFFDTTGEKDPPTGYNNYSSSLLPRFIKALKGLKEGETKTITIPPEEGYGLWNETLAETMGMGSIPRDSLTYAFKQINKTSFTSSFPNVTLAVNTRFDIGADQYFGFGVEGVFNATIVNITETNVTVKTTVENGSTFILPLFGFNTTVVVLNDSYYILHLDTELNHIFSIKTYHGYLHFKVIGINETSIKLALNTQSPRASFVGETLVFEIHVVNVYKTSQQD
ncbi:MAG TPA: hypothetical protein ENL13_03700 [Thermoplasmatales archaeon]|nr:hypothetical protein [Thermoplasmatales archaeon]